MELPQPWTDLADIAPLSACAAGNLQAPISGL